MKPDLSSLRRPAAALFLSLAMASPAALSACSGEEPATIERQDIALAYTEAYNAGDVEAMAALMHPDIEWYAMGEEELELVTAGKPDLVSELEAYFASGQSVTSTLSDLRQTGDGVRAVETASWTDEAGEAEVAIGRGNLHN